MKLPQTLLDILYNIKSEEAAACWTCEHRPFHLPTCDYFLTGNCTCGAVERKNPNPCLTCKERPFHMSDCAVYNEPAFPNGVCNCGAKYNEHIDTWLHSLELFTSAGAMRKAQKKYCIRCSFNPSVQSNNADA
jgi:hypothetical protein